MTEILDASGDALIIRRPDGSVYLDTRHRHAASYHTNTFTNVNVVFPKASTEAFSQNSNNEGRWTLSAAENLSYTTILGALPSGFIPNWILANIRLVSRTNGNQFQGVTVTQIFSHPAGTSVPFVGSIWIERVQGATGTICMNRHISLGVSGGNLVIVGRQSHAAFDSGKYYYFQGFPPSYVNSTWVFEIDVECGIYDLGI